MRIWRTTILLCLHMQWIFFKEHVSFKNLILKHFFTSFFNNLLTKDLVTLGNMLSTKFMKP